MHWMLSILLLCSMSSLAYSGVDSEDYGSNPGVTNNHSQVLLTGAERIAKIQMLLKDPNATFFTGENMTGEALELNSSLADDEGCHQYSPEIQSMRISTSCFRVFKGVTCHGMSRSIYPKPNSGSFINFLTPELPIAFSVGPCLPNEFRYANVKFNGPNMVAITKDESNVRQVPDFVDFIDSAEFYSKSTQVKSESNPIDKYYMDQGRPKWIRAVIRRKHLNQSMAGGFEERNLAIPLKFGAPANEAYNTFPQSQNNFEEWKLITDRFEPFLKAGANYELRVHVTFGYETSSETKPYGFYYHVSFERGISWSLYGFIEN